MKVLVLLVFLAVVAAFPAPQRQQRKKEEKYIVYPGVDVDNAVVATWLNGYSSPWNVAFGNQPYVVGWVGQDDDPGDWEPFEESDDYTDEEYTDDVTDVGIDVPHDEVVADREKKNQKKILIEKRNIPETKARSKIGLKPGLKPFNSNEILEVRVKRNGGDWIGYVAGLTGWAGQQDEEEEEDSSWDSDDDQDSAIFSEEFDDEVLADVGVEAPHDEVDANRGKTRKEDSRPKNGLERKSVGSGKTIEFIKRPIEAAMDALDLTFDAPHDYVHLDRGRPQVK